MATKKKLPSHLDQSAVEGRVPGPWEATGTSSYLGGAKAGFKKNSQPKGGSRVPTADGIADPRSREARSSFFRLGLGPTGAVSVR
jgi:hypothetical protein